jgi:hypothetical protein
MKIDVRTTNFLALPYVGICVYKSERANNEQGFSKSLPPQRGEFISIDTYLSTIQLQSW